VIVMRESVDTTGKMLEVGGMAFIAGGIATVLSLMFGGLSWPGSIFVGVLVFVVLAALFFALFMPPLPAARSVSSRPQAAPIPVVVVPASVVPASVVTVAVAPVAVAPVAVAPVAVAPVVAVPVAPMAEPASVAMPASAALSEPISVSVTELRPVAPDGKPALYDAPQGGLPDDLKQIRGIGPKMEAMLNRMGIWHFAQVGSWWAEEVAWVDTNLEGFKGRVVRDDWVSQARILAAGGETAFSQRIERGDVV